MTKKTAHVDPEFYAAYGFCRSVCLECNRLDQEDEIEQARQTILSSNVIKFPPMKENQA